MINTGSLARIDHLALIAASLLRINSSRAVIKHQMAVPTLLPEHFTAHLGWAGAGPRQGEPKNPRRCQQTVWEPFSLIPNPGGKITSMPGDQHPGKTIPVVSLFPLLELNFNFSILPLWRAFSYWFLLLVVASNSGSNISNIYLCCHNKCQV